MFGRRLLLSLLILLFTGQVAVSQNVTGGLHNFKTYSIESGLPQSNVYCLLQDSRGYLWIGTDGGGVARFDGNTFITYNEANGLAGLVVRTLMEDSRGRIWMGTDGGISVYDGFSLDTITKFMGLHGSTVLAFAEDSHGTIWAATDDGGVNRIKSYTSDTANIDIYNDEEGGLSSNSVFDLHIDDQDKIWLATLYGGLVVLSPDGEYNEGERQNYAAEILRGGINIASDLLLSLEPTGDGGLWVGSYDAGSFLLRGSLEDGLEMERFPELSGTIWDITAASDGRVWFGTGDKGVVKATPNEGGYNFVVYAEELGMPNNQVLSTLEDTEGNIWIGTNGDGLVRFGGEVFSHISEDDGLLSNTVQAIDQDSVNNFWLASDGGGLTRMRFVMGLPFYEHVTTDQGLVSNYTTSLDVGMDMNRHIWVGTTNKGIVKFDAANKMDIYTEGDGMISDRVNDLYVDHNGIVWIATAGGISRFDGVKFLNVSMEKMIMSDEGVKTVMEDKHGDIWFGMAGGLARYSRHGSLTTYDEVEGLVHKDVNCITEGPEGNIWIGTNGGGLYFYNVHTEDSIMISFVANDSVLSSNSINSMIFLDDGTLVVTSDKGMDKVTLDGTSVTNVRSYTGSDGFIGVECNDNAIFKDHDGRVWIGTVKGLTCYYPSAERTNNPAPATHITDLRLFFKNVDWSDHAEALSPWSGLPVELDLPYHQNHLTFYFSGISLTNPEKVVYSYLLEGQDVDWSPPSPEAKVTYSGLSAGEYTLRVKARNAAGVWNEEGATYAFVISPPWYQTMTFYISVVIFLIVAVWGFIKWRERKLQAEKRILEEKVEERTREVVKQKEEIEEQKEIIEEKNREVMDSINYAKRIQEAMLPREEERQELIPDSFILFRPKDVVSGDFYWMTEKDDLVLFVAADCTGHGVPGAFMSMIGAALLNEVVMEKGITDAGKVLEMVREGIIKALSQTGAAGESKDGMDAALCVIDKKAKKLHYSGANNSLYLVREGPASIMNGEVQDLEVQMEMEKLKLYEVKADKQPVGYYGDEMKPFHSKTIDIEPGDVIYAFSDGYADQFGGPKGKKFMYKPFKELLLSLRDKPMEDQKEVLNQRIEDWMAYRDEVNETEEFEQVDDVLIIGVRF